MKLFCKKRGSEFTVSFALPRLAKLDLKLIPIERKLLGLPSQTKAQILHIYELIRLRLIVSFLNNTSMVAKRYQSKSSFMKNTSPVLKLEKVGYFKQLFFCF